MPEQRKREIAYKLFIGDILRGNPIIEDLDTINNNPADLNLNIETQSNLAQQQQGQNANQEIPIEAPAETPGDRDVPRAGEVAD